MVDAFMKNGILPLHYAIRHCQISSVNQLLDLGADTLLKDLDDLTALDHAIISDNACIKDLLFKKLNIKHLDIPLDYQLLYKWRKDASKIKEQIDSLKKQENA